MRWLHRAWTAFIALVVVACLLGFAAVRWLEYYLDTPGPLAEPRVVVVPSGQGVSGIADLLAERGIIDRPLAFELATRWAARDRPLKAGEYRIEANATPRAILDLLQSGRGLLHRITIPEGLTVSEVVALLRTSEVLTGELPSSLREGTLLPDTWLVPRGEPRARLVERMQALMQQELSERWAARAPDLPLKSPEQALTLASIVEKETSIAAEYPLVAAVFINRLRRGMKLQSDPTVIYALTNGEKSFDRELTRTDLGIDHPYNTYRIDGLPPGPIANPGRGALAGTLQPAHVDYLFFVADGTGGHAFASTLAEHNRNVARWRRVRSGVEPIVR